MRQRCDLGRVDWNGLVRSEGDASIGGAVAAHRDFGRIVRSTRCGPALHGTRCSR